jgi:hypothetical protein
LSERSQTEADAEAEAEAEAGTDEGSTVASSSMANSTVAIRSLPQLSPLSLDGGKASSPPAAEAAAARPALHASRAFILPPSLPFFSTICTLPISKYARKFNACKAIAPSHDLRALRFIPSMNCDAPISRSS